MTNLFNELSGTPSFIHKCSLYCIVIIIIIIIIIIITGVACQRNCRTLPIHETCFWCWRIQGIILNCDLFFMTCDVWRVICDVWCVTCDVWRVTYFPVPPYSIPTRPCSSRRSVRCYTSHVTRHTSHVTRHSLLRELWYWRDALSRQEGQDLKPQTLNPKP